MPSSFSNDVDLVRPTQYIIPPLKKAKNPAPAPWKLPTFKPLQINNFYLEGTPNLPPNVDNNDLLALFRLFITYKIVNNIINWTNLYIEHN